jgi:hypothetical protein
MATRNATFRLLANNVLLVEWTGLLNGDNGDGVQLPWAGDKTVHVFGTFGVGGSITLKGTNRDTIAPASDPALADPQGNAITKTSEAIEAVLENPLLLYPHVTAGDATTNLTCRVVAKPQSRP